MVSLIVVLFFLLLLLFEFLVVVGFRDVKLLVEIVVGDRDESRETINNLPFGL